MSKTINRSKIFVKNSGTGKIQTIVAGTNITVDNTDPHNPIINSSAATAITVVANYSALPAVGTVTGKFYWADASQGTKWLPGSLGGTYYSAGLYYSNGVSWEFLDVPYQATQASVDAGAITDQFVTPSTFTNASKWATKQNTLTPAALTKTDDTNVTLTLGGTPSTALLQASSLTLGWTGQLALTRGGTNGNLTADNGAIVYSNASSLALLASTVTASKMLLSGASTTPTWSTSTIPTSAGVTSLKWLRSDGTNYILSTSTLSDTPSTAGKIVVSDGTNWITSTPTFPNASATSGKIIISDGTNWIASTATYPSTTTVNQLLYSTGTNAVGGASTLTYNGTTFTAQGIIANASGLGIGTGVPSSGNPLSMIFSGNSQQYTFLQNTNTGSSAYVSFYVASDVSQYAIDCFSSNWANNNTIQTQGVRNIISGTGGYTLCTSNASGNIRFYAGSTTAESMRIAAGGNVGIGTSITTAGLLNIGAGTTTKAAISLNSGTNKTTPAGGDIEYDGTTVWFTNGGAQRQELVQFQQSRVSTQFDKTNDASLANITGLTATLVAGKTYSFIANLHVTDNVTAGGKFAIAGTCTATNIIYQIDMVDNSTNATTISSRQTALAGSAGQAGTTTGYCTIVGTITVANAGTLTVQFAQNAATPAVTSSVLVGSTFTVNQIV